MPEFHTIFGLKYFLSDFFLGGGANAPCPRIRRLFSTDSVVKYCYKMYRLH